MGMKKSKKHIEDIPVHCAHAELRDIANVFPNPRNPNKHLEKQIALLAKIIRGNGWRSPIVISKRSGFVVKGHGRLEAAKLLQLQSVPVDLQDYENEAMEWADVIADNRIAELSEIDNSTLEELLAELDGKLDMDLTGFDEKSLEDLMTQFNPEESSPQEIPEGFMVLIECKNEMEQTSLLSRFQKEGLKCKALIS